MKISNFYLHAAAGDAEISKLSLPGNTNFKPSASSTIAELLKGGSGGVDLVNLAFVAVGLVFFFNLIMAGWDYMLSSGDPKKAAIASARLTNGLTGLVMSITAFLVVKIIAMIFSIQTGF